MAPAKLLGGASGLNGAVPHDRGDRAVLWPERGSLAAGEGGCPSPERAGPFTERGRVTLLQETGSSLQNRSLD